MPVDRTAAARQRRRRERERRGLARFEALLPQHRTIDALIEVGRLAEGDAGDGAAVARAFEAFVDDACRRALRLGRA